MISNSIPQHENVKITKKIKVIDIAPMMAEAIRRIHNGESISVLFSM
jgi:ribose-phosphate pyrophosphokinase